MARLRGDRWAVALLVFGALVRLLFFVEARGVDLRHLASNDAHFHDDQARTLASGNWVLRDTPGVAIQRGAEDAVVVLGAERYAREFEPDSYTKYPGYDYLVAVFYRLFGPETRTIYAFQEALDLLACAFTYLLALRLYDRTVARVALALAVATGPLVLYAGMLLRETVLASLVVSVLYLVIRATDSRRSLGGWATAGVAFGAAWAVKPSIVPLVPFLLPSFASGAGSSGRRVAARLAAFALGAAATAGPLVARNVVLGLPPLRMATNELAALLFFNCPDAPARGVGVTDSCLASARRAAARCDRSSLWQGIREAAEENGGTAGLLRLEAARVGNELVADDPWDNVRYSYLRPCLRSLDLAPVRWKLIAPYVLLGVGLVLAQDPRRRAILLGPVFLVLFTSALSSCVTRYRILGDHLHALLAASAFVWLWREARRKHARAIVAALAALVVCQALKDRESPPSVDQIARYVLGSFGRETGTRLLHNMGVEVR